MILKLFQSRKRQKFPSYKAQAVHFLSRTGKKNQKLDMSVSCSYFIASSFEVVALITVHRTVDQMGFQCDTTEHSCDLECLRIPPC